MFALNSICWTEYWWLNDFLCHYIMRALNFFQRLDVCKFCDYLPKYFAFKYSICSNLYTLTINAPINIDRIRKAEDSSNLKNRSWKWHYICVNIMRRNAMKWHNHTDIYTHIYRNWQEPATKLDGYHSDCHWIGNCVHRTLHLATAMNWFMWCLAENKQITKDAILSSVRNTP